METKLRPEEVLEPVETKRLDPSSQFVLFSARKAWADAGRCDEGFARRQRVAAVAAGLGAGQIRVEVCVHRPRDV